MSVDLPNTLNLMRADLAKIEESLNGLRNIECADETPEDAAAIKAAIAEYEQWRILVAPIVANYEALGQKGYPMFPTFRISTAMKSRLQVELKASVVAESLFVGTPSAVSGVLNFGNPIPTKP